jgi:beta-glucanase (GH16 family)
VLHRSVVLFAVLTILTGCSSCAPQRSLGSKTASSVARPPVRSVQGGNPGGGATAGTVVFEDDFDGPLDTSVWRPYHSTYGDGNHELQCHTPSNVTTAGGVLTITARREQVTCPGGSVRQFSSGFLGTRETGHYFPMFGRYEMRARIPHGQGLWPAFWLRHRNGSGVAEVDVMEYFHATTPGQGTATLHLDGRKNLSKRSQWFEVPSDDPGWHTWAVDVALDPGGIRFTFSFDGMPFHTYVDGRHDWADHVDPNATWDMAVNLSVGGDWVGNPDGQLGVLGNGRCGKPWGSAPPCDTSMVRRATFPAEYQIDSVRVTTP